MLVLTRKIGEQVVVPQCQLTVTVLEVTSGRVRLGISAPANLVVHRSEVCDRIRAEEASEGKGDLMEVRILIADRDEYLTAEYREYLERQGAVVATAAGGVECMQVLRAFVPDVLVLDPALPWGGGDGVLALMHEEPEIRPPSVLLLTHGGDRGLLYRLSSFRVDDFQSKPLSPQRLLDRIRSLRLTPVTNAENGW
jgi:carbon storage regulator